MLSGWACGGVIFIDEFDSSEDAWSAALGPMSGDPGTTWSDGDWGGRTVNHGTTSTDADPLEREYVFTADSDATGDWLHTGQHGNRTVRQLQFDFYADSGVGNDGPAKLELFFRDTGGQHWFHDLGSIAGGWSDSLYVEVAYNYWYSIDGPDAESDWLASLGAVDQVGIYLTYQPGNPTQTYAIDNYMLRDDVIVPEPSTFLFLGVAFVSMGMSFRKRLHETLASMLKRATRLP